MSSAYGSTVVKPESVQNIDQLLPLRFTLKSGEPVAVTQVDRKNENDLQVLHELLNVEIRAGTRLFMN
jgi:hypothetical protein